MIVILLSLLVHVTVADYDCICTYSVETVIYPTKSTTDTPMGYMYEFDCKPYIADKSGPDSWAALAYQHQLGYVQTNGDTSIQTCGGTIPLEDKLTTTSPQTTTTPLPTTTTPLPTTTTPRPTTTTPQPTTTTPKPTTTTPRPTTATPQPTTTTPKPTTTTPRPTTTTPKPTTTTTPKPTTTTPLPTTTRPNPTTATPRPTTTTPQPTTTTPQPTTTTPTPTIAYGTFTCPRSVIYSNTNHKSYVSDSEQKCYELVSLPKHSWSYAEKDCQSRGGHLVTINNNYEKTMIHTFINEYGYDVWLGLRQYNHDGHFTWTSGEPLTYLNWSPYLNKTNDCVVMDPDTGTWNAVSCQTFYGYICEYDAIPSGSPIHISSTTTTRPTTTTTTIKPTTTPYQQGERTCPYNVIMASLHENALVFMSTFHQKCYEFVKSPTTDWVSAEQDCINKGGHLATIQDYMEEQILYTYTHNNSMPAWIGLTDRGSEGHFYWTSGKQMTYQNWHSNSNDPSHRGAADCVAIGVISGTWMDQYCTLKYSYFCEFKTVYKHSTSTPATTTVPPAIYFTQGNTNLCPSQIITEAQRFPYVHLGQYGSWCYELIVRSINWFDGENECKKRGGHLAYIKNRGEQDYIQSFTSQYNLQWAVWIGLNDVNQEGHFIWSSGYPVSFTNFLPNHTGNQGSRLAENCAALAPFEGGKWDDIPCGGRNVFGMEAGTALYPLCQFRISTSSQLIGK